MLINCKPGCVGRKSTTTASLDVDLDEVVCESCGEHLEVSSFIKTSMKQRGDIVRTENRKSFQFDCLTCGKNVETEVIGVNLVGAGCKKECKFNVSKFTIHAMKKIDPGVRSEPKSEVTDNFSKVKRRNK
jgi:hypothetical protein